MNDVTLGEIEAKFADLIWENEPLPSGELVKLAEAALGWKKSTTYTVLRRLCEKGLFRNENGEVRAAVSREEFNGLLSERFVNEAFGGSLPRFLTAFSRGKKLNGDEVAALLKFIDEHGGRGGACDGGFSDRIAHEPDGIGGDPRGPACAPRAEKGAEAVVLGALAHRPVPPAHALRDPAVGGPAESAGENGILMDGGFVPCDGSIGQRGQLPRSG